MSISGAPRPTPGASPYLVRSKPGGSGQAAGGAAAGDGPVSTGAAVGRLLPEARRACTWPPRPAVCAPPAPCRRRPRAPVPTGHRERCRGRTGWCRTCDLLRLVGARLVQPRQVAAAGGVSVRPAKQRHRGGGRGRGQGKASGMGRLPVAACPEQPAPAALPRALSTPSISKCQRLTTCPRW